MTDRAWACPTLTDSGVLARHTRSYASFGRDPYMQGLDIAPAGIGRIDHSARHKCAFWSTIKSARIAGGDPYRMAAELEGRRDAAGLFPGELAGDLQLAASDGLIYLRRCDDDAGRDEGQLLALQLAGRGGASDSRMFARNLFPSPAPSEAPLTIPAMSTNDTVAGMIFDEWLRQLARRGSGSDDADVRLDRLNG